MYLVVHLVHYKKSLRGFTLRKSSDRSERVLQKGMC